MPCGALRRAAEEMTAVYKAGEDEHSREVTAAAPTPLERAGARAGAARARLAALLVAHRRFAAAALIAIVVLGWMYGRESRQLHCRRRPCAPLDKVPGWAMVRGGGRRLVLALVTGYVAWGRHVALKIIGVAIVVVVLAMPGLALGWANGTVNT